ncbi:MAG TPA: ester cyclase [Anaerolineales bacterium]|nr:ester cyclase [Anaerolineales bacterium]
MDLKATAQALMSAVQMGEFEKAKKYLADDFLFSGAVPQPINAADWLEMSMSLKKAFPNLEYHFRVVSVQSDVVEISSELKGTHKGDLDLTSMNMGVIPPTHKSFAAGREHSKLTVHGDKVSAWVVEPNKSAGMTTILNLLGVKVTAH